MKFDRGFISPYFVTDAERMEAVLEDPFVLLCDQKIGALPDLIPVLEQVAKSGRSLLIIAEDIEGEALATLVVNRLRGVLKGLAVKAPRVRRSSEGNPGRHRNIDRCTGNLRGYRIEARECDAATARARRTRRRRQGKYNVDRQWRGSSADRRPHSANSTGDRENHQRLRSRKARGKASQALRWRCRDLRRRSDRGGHEGEEEEEGGPG